MHIALRNSEHRVSQLTLCSLPSLLAAVLIATQLLQIALAPGRSGKGRHVSMVLEWQLNSVCAAVLGRSHLLLIAATASARAMLLGLPHNAVQSSSILLYQVDSCNSLESTNYT